MGVLWLVSRRLKNAHTIFHHLWILLLINLPVLFILNLLVPVHSISAFAILPGHSELAASPAGDAPLDSLVVDLNPPCRHQYPPVSELESSDNRVQSLSLYQRWPEVLMLIWTLDAMLMLAKIFIGLIGLRCLTCSTLMADSSYQAICQRLDHQLEITRPVQVYVS